MGRTLLLDESFDNLTVWTDGLGEYAINPAGQVEGTGFDDDSYQGLYWNTVLIAGRSYYIEWECVYFSAEEPVDNSEGRICLGKQHGDGFLFNEAGSFSATIIAGNLSPDFLVGGPEFIISSSKDIDGEQGHGVIFRLTSLKLYLNELCIAMNA